jgi:hypothetical protein
MRKFVSRGFAIMALACCAAQFSVAQDAPVASAETEQHIQHVTSGLTSDVVIKGDEHATHMLADRMKELNISGLSIAVIHEGKIEWARGFGVSSIGGSPVTPETMFQAAPSASPWQPWRRSGWSSRASSRWMRTLTRFSPLGKSPQTQWLSVSQ